MQPLDPDDLDRTEMPFADGSAGRVYFSDDLPPVPSVTTILDERTDPDKKAALEGWRNRYDGSRKYASPHYSDQLAYKSARGTLGHWAILSDLGEVPKSHEEEDAEYMLKNWATERPTVNDGIDCAAPFGDPDHYEGEQAWTRCMRDINWAIDEFSTVAPELGITEDSVLDVEKYVADSDYGFAGQFDLLYENNCGETTLCDLKLSSGIRVDYKLQSAAYQYALPHEVDRLEIIRLYPDKQEVEVSSSDDWNRSISDYTSQFLDLTRLAHATKIDPLDQQTINDAVSNATAD